MELYMMKSYDDTLYFQLEDCNEARSVLNYIAQKFFGCVRFMENPEERLIFSIKKDLYMPESEWHSLGNIFSSAIIDGKYVHLFIKGIDEKSRDKIGSHIMKIHDSTILDGRHMCVHIKCNLL